MGASPTSCPRCQAETSAGALYCGTCGALLAAAQGPDELLGAIVAERYRIVGRLGRSGLGAVYQAEHVGMGKTMAVKVMDRELSGSAELVRDFNQIVRSASRLTSMHTATIFDFGEFEGLIFVVSDFLRGVDLGSLVQSEGCLSVERVVGITEQAAMSLGEAHAADILHRGLKPGNIFVTQTREGEDFVKILDFGLAALAEQEDEASAGRSGRLQGFPHCMSPEQVRGEPLDRRSDVYSYGTLLYLMLTGQFAFTGRTPVSVLAKHLTQRPEAPSARNPEAAISPAVDGVVLQALEKDPNSRFTDLEVLAAALARANA